VTVQNRKLLKPMIDPDEHARISGLYAITPDTTDTSQLCRMVDCVLSGGARFIQYRNKTASSRLRLTQSRAIYLLCKKHRVPLIINDHLDLALEIGADGLHVGQNDTSIMEVRDVLGRDKIVGVSCYNQLSLAVEAEKAGANYVALGAFYPSATKADAARASISLLDETKKTLNIPIVAIGGINLNNAENLIVHGCDAIAVSQALFSTRDVRSTAQHFSRFFSRQIFL
jgi:thiamine-phosphate pyrophosphorylase